MFILLLFLINTYMEYTYYLLFKIIVFKLLFKINFIQICERIVFVTIVKTIILLLNFNIIWKNILKIFL